MTPPQSNTTPDAPPEPFRWSRLDAAEARHAFHDPSRPPDSQRQFARQTAVPRTTLQHWIRNEPHPDIDPDVVAFYRSPAGERFLRRLLLALHLVFHQAGHAGLRPLGRFLALSQLDRFVAPSYGAQHALATRLQADLLAFAQEQRRALAAAMTPKAITLCTDENFHGDLVCLVAIEPVSNFLLVEEYRERRDGPTWTAVIQEAIHGMPVQVIQMTSDQAKGLLACARDGLDAHHSPDLFHDQREVSRATSLPLSRHVEAAEKELAAAVELTAAWRTQQQQYEAGPRPPGRAPDFAGRIDVCQKLEQHAAEQVQACQQRHERARQAVRGLADDYHPFDQATGQPVTAQEVQQRLGRRLGAVEAVVTEAGLGEKAQAAVAKVRRWLVPLVATVAWFWARARERVEELDLGVAAERVLYEQLLPGLYWQQAARRGRDAEQRQQGKTLSERLLTKAWASRGPLGRLPEEEQARVRRVASEVAQLFCRSSSCVEGRNGQLSLHHHGQGALSTGRLKALTVVHNYLQVRADETTAAERFFGVKPADLFAWLLERFPDLPRPAERRKRANQEPSAG